MKIIFYQLQMYCFPASKIAHKTRGVIQETIRDVHSVGENKLNFAGFNGFSMCPKYFLCPFKNSLFCRAVALWV